MKSHITIFFRIFLQVVLYTIIPAVIYILIISVLHAFGIAVFSQSVEMLVIDGITLIVTFVLFNYYSSSVRRLVLRTHLQIKKLLLLVPISLFSRIPLAVIVIILYLFFGEAVTQTLDKSIEYQWAVFDGSTFGTTCIGFLSFVVIGPLHEELIYRGVIQRTLQSQYSGRISIIVASVFFGVSHIQPGLIVSSFVLGLFLGYVFHKWHNLWYAIILHMLINLQPFIM